MTISEDQVQPDGTDVYRGPKVCKECGKAFTGSSWCPWKNDDHIKVGVCPDCVERYQDKIERFSNKKQREPGDETGQDVELEPPIITGEDYERRYP